MDNKTANFNESEFLEKLKNLYDLEIQKPLKEINTEFIDEIVSLSLEIQGLKAELTPEEVEEKVRKIPFVEIATLNTTPESVKGRATKVKSHKILLIAAIISILVAIFTITSIAFDWNIFDELKNRFGTVANAPTNEEIDVGGISVYMYGEDVKYRNFEEFIKKEKLSVLYPSKLSKDLVLTGASIYKENQKIKLDYIFNELDFIYSITFDQGLSDELKLIANDVLVINDLKCFVLEMPDVETLQVYFEYKNNLYYISFNNKQDLIEIIENLKELEWNLRACLQFYLH